MKLKTTLLSCALVLMATGASAEDFPTGRVDYIIPFGPGGESDVTARFQQPFFEELFGEQMVVAYQPGGGGAVGWSQLNGMAGDGSLIMGINLPHIIIKPQQGDVGFQTEDLAAVMFAIAAVVAGLAGVMYGPLNPPNYHMGMDFLVLSFVVVVVGGMGSLGGAVLAGFMLGILESFASTTWATTTIPGINQIIIYLVAIIVLLTRPRGLMGRRGVMEE